MELIYQARELSRVHQDDISGFLDHTPPLRCLSDPDGETQVWLSDSQQTVFKVFDIRRRGQQWRARRRMECPRYGKRFGWAELANAQRMQHLDVQAPAPLAYLEKRNALFCSRQIVAYPFLGHHQTLQDHIAQTQAPFATLDRVERVLYRMALEGAFHLDLNSRNIMVDETGDVQLIDFEYMAWDRTRKGRLYAYYLGYLLQKWLHQHLDATDYRAWFEEVLHRRHTTLNENEGEMRRWFHTARLRELSRLERFRIFV